MNSRAADVGQRLSTGTVSRGFEAVKHQLDAYLLADPTYSAQLAVYYKGELIVDLVGGADLDSDTVTGVFSASKGVAAIVIAQLIEQGLLVLDAPVADYWPEFAARGKQAITVRQLLSHQSGVLGAESGLERAEVLSSSLAAAKLADTAPRWLPGSAFGYHGLSIGVFMEELVRRVTGSTLQQYYETNIRAPRDIDFYLGFPEGQEVRFRELLPLRPTASQQAAMDQQPDTDDSISSLSFNSLHKSDLPLSGALSPNIREVRAAGPVAVGGIGSARGLATVYASAIGELGGPALLGADTIELVSQQQAWGHDRVLNADMCFGVVFMKPQPRMEFGSFRAFGHDGAGGALGFADPLYDLAFGYIPMPMQYPGGADPKSLVLSRTVRSCIALVS
jgi:CubicO group peptidase (beta-lactamase class C family)